VRAVQALSPRGGDPTTVVLRALEEYVTATHKRRGRQGRGKHKHLVNALSTSVAALNLPARPASALKMLNIRYAYELVQKSQTDLFRLPNFGNKSLRVVKDKLATLGLTLAMAREDDNYRAAVVATAAESIRPPRTKA
jgi:DNA-directed RNA polymerase alpha subunit